MDVDDARMLGRLSMQIIGGSLVTYGVGNAAMWESLAGAASILAGYYLSKRARRQLVDRTNAQQ